MGLQVELDNIAVGESQVLSRRISSLSEMFCIRSLSGPDELNTVADLSMTSI